MKIKLMLFSCLLTIARARFAKRLFEGMNTRPYDYQNMVAIVAPAPEPNSEELFCGGILYTTQWVTCTGACVLNIDIIFPMETVLVLAGKWKLTLSEPFQQTRFVAHAIKHPEFDPDEIGKSIDLGLIKVTERFRFNLMVHALHFSSDLSYPSGRVKLLGWGCRTEEEERNKTPTAILQSLRDNVPNYEACKFGIKRILRGYGMPLSPDSVNEFHFCTGTFTHDRKGPSYGDSGGPVLKANSLGFYEVIGVIVVGLKKPNLGIHIHVAPFIPWINHTIEYFSD